MGGLSVSHLARTSLSLVHDAVVAGASDTQTVSVTDGRTLTFAEWGDLDGFPVFFLHGTPGSRFLRHYDESKYAEVGARVITYDRPGYGGSDRDRGRRAVDCVADVAAIADQLGVERFAVIGASGGGPHSLAVAARLPERVTRATCAVGVVPFDTPDFDWFEGMDPLNVKEIGWALEGEDVLAPELEREAAEMLERVAADPSKLMGDDWQLSEADRAELARTERHDVIRQTVNEAYRRGVWGWVDDDLCLTRPWGFDVAEIRVPTRVIYGLTDVLVPWRQGEWLARNVPNAEVVVEEHRGHLPDPDLVAERYGWLVQPV
jgi:pimeloyl-ACP methyl ester carboxylesterase